MNHGPEFFQTGMGKQFFGSDVPKATKAMTSIAKDLEIIAQALNENTINGLINSINRLASAQEQANEIELRKMGIVSE